MWSKETLERTVDALSDIKNSSLKDLPLVCMKKYDLDAFGIIIVSDLLEGKYEIMDRTTKECYKYASVQELVVDNGWVID